MLGTHGALRPRPPSTPPARSRRLEGRTGPGRATPTAAMLHQLLPLAPLPSALSVLLDQERHPQQFSCHMRPPTGSTLARSPPPPLAAASAWMPRPAATVALDARGGRRTLGPRKFDCQASKPDCHGCAGCEGGPQVQRGGGHTPACLPAKRQSLMPSGQA